MPFKKYREHLIYKRFEKKVSTPPPSTSTSLQSVPLSTTGSFATNTSVDPGSTRSSPSRSITQPVFLDDEYNPYRYGLVPLSERNIYREFQVIRPPKNMVWKEGQESKSSTGTLDKSVPNVLAPSLSSNTKSLDREKKTVRIMESKQQEKVNGSGKKTTSAGATAGKQEIIIPIRKEYSLATEPVPTTVRSYKCTSYTLNEIRSC